MNKKERKLLEQRTTYKVFKAYHNVDDVYAVQRLVDGVMDDNYHVTLKWHDSPNEILPKVIWCDCAGFKCQKFAHIEHKHIKLVSHYQALGEPIWATYRIKGTGAHTEIEFIQSHTEELQDDT